MSIIYNQKGLIILRTTFLQVREQMMYKFCLAHNVSLAPRMTRPEAGLPWFSAEGFLFGK